MAQLVARYLGVVEAAGSNPVTQTISSVHNESDEHSIFFCLYFVVGSRISALFLLLCRGGQIVYSSSPANFKTYSACILSLSGATCKCAADFSIILENFSCGILASSESTD